MPAATAPNRRSRGAAHGKGGDGGCDGGEGGVQAVRGCDHAERSVPPACLALIELSTAWHHATEEPVAFCDAPSIETGTLNKHAP